MLDIDLATQKAVVRSTLATRGIARALALLNDRTAYRYSAIYKLGSDGMQVVHLFDRHAEYRTWPTALPLSHRFSQFLMAHGQIVISHVSGPRALALLPHASLAASYYGKLLEHDGGIPYGAFVHFDLEPRTIRAREISFLQDVVPHFMLYLD